MVEELLTVTQSAQYLHVCEKTIRRLIASEQLTASKVGRAWRIKRKEIDNYLQSNTNRSLETPEPSNENISYRDGVVK